MHSLTKLLYEFMSPEELTKEYILFAWPWISPARAGLYGIDRNFNLHSIVHEWWHVWLPCLPWRDRCEAWEGVSSWPEIGVAWRSIQDGH